MSVQRRRPRGAFSLVELLVVIGVLGLLASLLVPAVQRVRAAAARVACANNLRQIGLACQHYVEVEGTLPAAYVNDRRTGRFALLNWPVLLLPYIEQEPLWRQTLEAYRADWYPYHNPPHVGLATVIRLYACPADGRLTAPITDDQGNTAAYGSYLGVAGGTRADGAMRRQRGVRLAEITDGTSQTLLVGERPPRGRLRLGSWYTSVAAVDSSAVWREALPYMHVFEAGDIGSCLGPFQFGPGRLENQCDYYHFWSLHHGGANFLVADGSVHFLSYAAAPLMIPLATRAGGEAVTVPD
jgi:prepilin-type N-terminal cleavage/methylation domain-containing protein